LRKIFPGSGASCCAGGLLDFEKLHRTICNRVGKIDLHRQTGKPLQQSVSSPSQVGKLLMIQIGLQEEELKFIFEEQAIVVADEDDLPRLASLHQE